MKKPSQERSGAAPPDKRGYCWPRFPDAENRNTLSASIMTSIGVCPLVLKLVSLQERKIASMSQGKNSQIGFDLPPARDT
jgi:hypothetical protein